MRRLVWIAVLVAACTPGQTGTVPEPETSVEILRDIQLADDARFPERDGQLVDVEVYEDRLVFVYSGPPAIRLEPGQVVAGTRGGGYLRRLVTVAELEPTRFEAATVHAELGELILDGHFIVRMRPRQNSFEVEGDIGSTTEALDGAISLFTPEVRNVSCNGSEMGSVTFTPVFDLDLDADIEIDLRTDWSRIIPRGELHSARFELYGGLEAGLDIATTRSTSISCEWDLLGYYARRIGGQVPKTKWTTVVPVGPIAIPITHTIEPTFSVSVGGSVQTGATTKSMRGSIGLRAGAQYTREAGWQPIWQPSRSGSVNLTVSEPGSLSVTGSASGGIGYIARLFNAVGPGVSLTPGVTGTFTVSSDRCTWNAEVSAGVNLNLYAQLRVPVIDYKVAEVQGSQSLVRATVAQGMGTFPWCADAGMAPLDGGMPSMPMDGGTGGGDGGTPPMSMDGGTGDGGTGGDDGGSDPCSGASTCQDCNAIIGCGYCVATGRCLRDARRGECPASLWQDSPSECEVCSGHGSCSECVRDAFCGWCASSGRCLTAESGGAPPEPCADWNFSAVESCR